MASRIAGIGLPDVDGVFLPGYRGIPFKVAAVIEGVNAGAVEAFDMAQFRSWLGDHSDGNEPAENARVGGIEHQVRLLDRVEMFSDSTELFVRLGDRVPDSMHALR